MFTEIGDASSISAGRMAVRMVSDDRTGQDWSDQEVELIVADYFSMRDMELRGESYVKAHRNAELYRLTGRSRGSIEFKHQNISAVLMTLGEPWIQGYKPMMNFQRALIDGVERFLIAVINNPAGSAKAQSSIPLALDGIGGTAQHNGNISNNSNRMAGRYNHVPGGCNVLWLDGHVEFIKYPGKFPIVHWATTQGLGGTTDAVLPGNTFNLYNSPMYN